MMQQRNWRLSDDATEPNRMVYSGHYGFDSSRRIHNIIWEDFRLKNDYSEKIIYTPSRSEAKVISPLAKFLMEQPMEHLLNFLQKLGVRYSISGNIADSDRKVCHHRCKIFVQYKHPERGTIQTFEKYVGTSSLTVRTAVANAVAKFMVCEDHDYHEYKGMKGDTSVEETHV